ncbi:MAG: GGDEF domain-containing protein [Elusimicrobiales bacterium]|nr:GGDEF domain-containing protein [Elusimicrobiales bacterium]
MSNIGSLYLFLPLVIYGLSLININLAKFVLIIIFIISVAVFKSNNIVSLIYSLFASLIIIIKMKDRNLADTAEIKELEEILEEKEKKLIDLKKSVENIKVYEKKNEIIYSVVNMLRFITDVEHLKSIKKYIDEYLECETSLVFLSDNNAKFVYGRNVYLQQSDEPILITDSYIAINITDKGKKMFMLIIHSKDNSKIEEAKEIIGEIGSSLKKIYLFEMTENMSQKDGLTGLFRRSIFAEKLEEEIIKAKNFKHTVGVMMIDIDHFKYINDTYGHQVGDEVLREVANILKENVYETDFVARYGGEEFAVIMPRAQIEGSSRKANHIRETIGFRRIRAGLVDIKVTVSIGIAYYPYDAISSQELIEKADKALYFSKENGRNRVTIYRDI